MPARHTMRAASTRLLCVDVNVQVSAVAKGPARYADSCSSCSSLDEGERSGCMPNSSVERQPSQVYVKYCQLNSSDNGPVDYTKRLRLRRKLSTCRGEIFYVRSFGQSLEIPEFP